MKSPKHSGYTISDIILSAFFAFLYMLNEQKQMVKG